MPDVATTESFSKRSLFSVFLLKMHFMCTHAVAKQSGTA